MAKTFRRTIRISGEEVKSPRFGLKSDADLWYDEQRRLKRLSDAGISLPTDKTTTLAEFFDRRWIVERKKSYPESTTSSDEQRFNDYVRKSLGAKPVSKINQLAVRNALRAVVERGRSVETRNRVRALLSKIFNDAMNEDPPLRADNPAVNISFNDPRTGRRKPDFIKREADIAKFLKSAKSLTSNHYAYAAIALMAGLRKSEIIPLSWSDFDDTESALDISKRFMQAANKIRKGTKGGSDETRVVVIPDALVKVLTKHREQSDYQGDTDFILSRNDGKNFGPRELHDLHKEIVEASGVKITPHGLRHTFGREWVKRGGSMKGLQTVLGHSNSQITDLYSELAGKQVKRERNTVSFEVDDE